MKITFKKDHLDFKAGDSHDIEEGIAEYLILMDVAKPFKKTVNKSKEDDKG